MPETIEALVDGGNATPGPPLGPVLGPLGINIMDVIKVINEKTKAFEGMKVPVKVVVDTTTQEFEISVGTPPTSALILKELGLEKGSSNPRTDKVGDLSVEQLKKIALMKVDSLGGVTVAEMAKEIAGTCVSLGVTIDSKDPREIQKLINEGAYNGVLTEP
ncbi:MAG: 50S ribosomal protein L11 [Thermoplasmata archaeon]|nr:MAG: 50S ribosomal protein L11 [Thermoplasmata archaeon]